jgi:hypothetical protein
VQSPENFGYSRQTSAASKGLMPQGTAVVDSQALGAEDENPGDAHKQHVDSCALRETPRWTVISASTCSTSLPKVPPASTRLTAHQPSCPASCIHASLPGVGLIPRHRCESTNDVTPIGTKIVRANTR